MHIKYVIYVTEVFIVTVHYKGEKKFEVLSRSCVVKLMGIFNFLRPLCFLLKYIFSAVSLLSSPDKS